MMKAWFIGACVLAVGVPLAQYYGGHDVVLRVRTLETGEFTRVRDLAYRIGYLCHATGMSLDDCKRDYTEQWGKLQTSGLKGEYCVGVGCDASPQGR